MSITSDDTICMLRCGNNFTLGCFHYKRLFFVQSIFYILIGVGRRIDMAEYLQMKADLGNFLALRRLPLQIYSIKFNMY